MRGMALVCINCRGPHLATDSSCSLMERQKRVASLAATENIPFVEAGNKINQSLSNSPSSPYSNTNPFNEYDVRTDFTNFPQFPSLKRSYNPNLNNSPENVFSTNRFEMLNNTTEKMASSNTRTYPQSYSYADDTAGASQTSSRNYGRSRDKRSPSLFNAMQARRVKRPRNTPHRCGDLIQENTTNTLMTDPLPPPHKVTELYLNL